MAVRKRKPTSSGRRFQSVSDFAEITKDRPERTLVVVGDGPERRRLESSAPANVRFLGVVDDPTLRWCYERAAVHVSVAFGASPGGVGGGQLTAPIVGSLTDTDVRSVLPVFLM